ncbi:MAG: hypothetical protein ACREMP_01470 [Candidatus Tyrphobacter sp.]
MRVGPLAIIAAVAIAIALGAHFNASAAGSAHHPARHVPSPQPSVIEHAQVRPLCSALVHHIAPAIAMMTQNDATIARSPGLLTRYERDLDNENQEGDPGDTAARDMTLEHLEALVGPLANNVNAINSELSNTQTFAQHPSNSDERELDALRDQLLKALATQAVALDIINGYVQTQRLADMQHEGLQGAEINSIQNSDTTVHAQQPTPNPLLVDPNQAGIQQSPYEMDPLDVPGITGSVGNTPLSRLVDAMQWLRRETTRRENIASSTIIRAARSCAPRVAPSSH